MPALYAHYYFGKRVYRSLQGDLKKVLRTHFRSFRMGLQGPDLFLYHGLLKADKITELGYTLHSNPFSEFLKKAVKVVKEKGMDSGEYAYLLGFLCHFTLDSETHPYVDKYAENNNVTHVYMETEFDKYILKREGLDPIKTDISFCISRNKETAGHIASFFDEIKSEWVALGIMNEMYFERQLLYTPYEWRYKLMLFLFDYFPKIRSKGELMIHKEDHKKCVESNLYLFKKLEESIDLAITLMHALDETIRSDAELVKRFDRNFETLD